MQELSLATPGHRVRHVRSARFAGFAWLLLLAGCGGGGSDKSPAPSPSPSNRVPTVQGGAVTTSEDTAVSSTLLATDPDGDTLTLSVAVPPLHGTVAFAGAGFSYTPAADYNGSDQFSVRAHDGKSFSAPAVISVSITPVNDAPSIDAINGPVDVDGRSTASLAIAARDVDGDTLSFSTQQLAGSSAAASVSGGVLSVTVPDLQAVETLGFRITASDGSVSVSRDVSLRGLPLSASGKLRTVRGSRIGPGLHLVITGDGYTTGEQGRLRSDAMALAASVVDTPDVAAYSRVWNVHVLDQVSAESGTDIPSQSVVRATAFDGTLDCAGVARLLCINYTKVQNAVLPEFPAYTQIFVTSNTDIYGGSGGPMIAVSRHALAPLIALHEVGHSFASLVDEYLDSQLDTGPVAINEAAVPNTTRINDLAQVKWRHWFVNPGAVPRNPGEAGVGLFEGSYYRAVGYYRPTDNSFMRTLSTNMGAVNAEQWIKSIYLRIGAVGDVTPAATMFSLPAGTTVALGVTPNLGAPLQEVRWYEDGIEVVDARGKPAFI